MLAAYLVIVITIAAYPLAAQDTTTRKDSVPTPAMPSYPAGQTPVTPTPPPVPAPTLEQTRYLEGLKTATRGLAQLRDGLNRVARAQQADSTTRKHAARRLGGLCTSARSFISNGRPKMQATAYADSMRILAKQLTMRLDSLSAALPACEKTAATDPSVPTTLTARLKNYDDALLAFRTAQGATKPDSSKTVSQQQHM